VFGFPSSFCGNNRGGCHSASWRNPLDSAVPRMIAKHFNSSCLAQAPAKARILLHAFPAPPPRPQRRRGAPETQFLMRDDFSI